VIEFWHDLRQLVELRKVFNDINLINGVDFVRHVYLKNNSLFQATKIAARDKIDRFELSTYGLPENEHVTFGVLGHSMIRIFKSGVMQFAYYIN
jgi:hypothetical protein